MLYHKMAKILSVILISVLFFNNDVLAYTNLRPRSAAVDRTGQEVAAVLQSNEIVLGELGFNPLQALKDPEILNVFRQIIELRYDVRVLCEIYGLGEVPTYLTHNGEKLTVGDYVDKMIRFLINRADQNPHVVARAFREEFPNMARPPELNSIFDEYMKIKIKEFDLEVVKDTIPPNSILADIGAGKNKLGHQILEYSDEIGLNVRHVIGTDLNDWADKTENPDPRLLFIYQESGTRFPLSANTYDVVITKWVLHHMRYEDQVAFLRSINHILRHGGRLVIFDSLGATLDEKEIWKGFETETLNPKTWPRGSFFDTNFKLTHDFMKLNSEQQLKVHALEDFFGHNLVMGRDWMPQPFTYRSISELNELLIQLGFTENKSLRRVYGSAPIMRMGPPSIRLVFEKNRVTPTLAYGGGGENKAMVLIDGITETEKEHVRNLLSVLVYQDLLRKDLEGKKFDDAVILGNDRLDTFSEALELVDSGICKRIIIIGRKFGRATIPLIDSAVRYGFEIKISPETVINNENWEPIKKEASLRGLDKLTSLTEPNIIRQIIMQLIEAYPEEFHNVKKKIYAEGIDNILVLIDTPDEVRKLFIEYRNLLDKEGAFDRKERHGIIFLHKPQQQLRSKAAFDEILGAELRQDKVQIVSHSVSYDNVEMEKSLAVKDLLGEIWRLIIYSDHGTGYINLRGEKYPRGIEDIPESFWRSAIILFNFLEDADRQEIAKELLGLVKEEGLLIDEIIPNGKPVIKEFVESIIAGLGLKETATQSQRFEIDTQLDRLISQSA
jgi:SAM-dependent methyltransferase